MIILMTPLVWIMASLSCVSAVPSDTFSGNGTSIARRDTANASPYSNSLQLILTGFPPRQYNWFIYQGDQGIAVNPCDGSSKNPFTKVFHGDTFTDSVDAINHPSFPGSDVYATIPYDRDCAYHGTGVDVGQFRCAEWYIIDCAKDPRYGEATFKCPDGRQYHRAYNCEF